MKKATLSLIIFLAGFSGLAFQSWERVRPPAAAEFTSVIAHPLDAGKLIAASREEIFIGISNERWQRLPSQGHGEIKRLYFFEEHPMAVFVLTSEAVYRVNLSNQDQRGQTRGSDPLGQWREAYRGRGSKKRILSFAVLPGDPEHWFAGTESGLLESDDAGKTWFRFHRFPEKTRISLVRFAGGSLFIATSERLYVSRDLDHFQPVFSLLSGDDSEFLEIEETEESSDPEENSNSSPLFFDLTTEEKGGRLLWLASKKGVLESHDEGVHWAMLSRTGLQDTQIRHLAYAPAARQLFAGTARGIYVYLPEARRWQEIFHGLARPEAKALTVQAGEPETLIAVTGDGLMRYSIVVDGMEIPEGISLSGHNLNLFRELVRREPTAIQIQKEVVRYANLGNGKIKRWHAESRFASLLPNFSFGRDLSKDSNIDIDRGSTNEPDRFIFGPDDTDKGWDADVSWDLGDFVWSSNQTSIDSREKLMVELRNDLLAEAVRIYYERRRLQTEIVFTPAASEREHLERLIRMDELTSLLDGMTDGFLSHELEKIYEEFPEFRRLWEFRQSKNDVSRE